MLFLCPKNVSWTSFSRSSGLHSFYCNHHPHLCVFYRAILIDCNIFYCHSTACSAVGRVSLTIRSIWNRCVVLLKCVKGFLSLCCGYFETFSKLGYKSHPIILSTLDSRSKEVEMQIGSVEKRLFNFCFCFWLTKRDDNLIQQCVKYSLSREEQSELLRTFKQYSNC